MALTMHDILAVEIRMLPRKYVALHPERGNALMAMLSPNLKYLLNVRHVIAVS
jgi:hypothetical protein